MAMATIQDLLKHDLGDLLYAEKQILKALPKMIRQTSDTEMKDRLQEHHGETEQHVENLEKAFEAMGLKPKAQKCPGILGIIEEKKEFEEDEKPTPPVLESFNLGAGLRVENYEIAAYRSALALAKSLGQPAVAEFLQANLDQEVAMARFIESSSSRVLQSVQAAAREEEMSETSTGGNSRKPTGAKSTGKSGSKSSSESSS